MKALLIIFLVISILALIPAGVDGGYSGGALSLNVKLFGFSLNLYPKLIKKLGKKPKKEKKKAAGSEKKEKKKKKEKKPKKKLSFTREDIIPLIKMGLRTLGRLKRKTDLHYLRLVYIIGGDDPSDTITGYMKAKAVISTMTPLIDSAFGCIKEKDVGVRYRFYPFSSDFSFWVTASVQLWVVFYIGGALLIDFLKYKKSKGSGGQKPRKSLQNERTA